MEYIISTGGKQYRLTPDKPITIEKLDAKVNDQIIFDKVLMTIDGDQVTIGTPYIEGASVTAEVKEQGRDKKKIVFRYHNKTRYRKLKGHRQPLTKVSLQ